MTWTQFWDMHSGGGCKEPPYEKIYIEAPQDEAELVFYNRFGHNPSRVTCTCCGEDYSMSESETLAEASAYHRGCYSFQRKTYNKDKGGWDHRYVEEPEAKAMKVPRGYELRKAGFSSDKYMTVEQYEQQESVLVIHADDIEPHERRGSLPTQGYVWLD